MRNQKTRASQIAFGGVMAALAVVVMSLGGLIPIATYTSPMICAIILQLVLNACGERIAWAWFGAVAILGMLLSPDREAAGVFLFLGYYPIMKPKLEKKKLQILWKTLFFNLSILVLYWLLLSVFGMAELQSEFSEYGKWMLCILLLLGNITFFMLDYLLGMRKLQRKK